VRAVTARLAGPGLIAGAAGATAARLILPATAGEALAAATVPAMVLAAAVAALAATRAAGRIPEQALIGAGAVCAGGGMWLAATGLGGAAGTAGLVVAAAGLGPSVALQRLLIAESAESLRPGPLTWPARDAEGNEARFVLFGWYWTALTLGVLGVFLASMVQPVGIGAVLRGAGAVAAAGGLLSLLRPLPGADPGSSGVAAADVPWARRATAAAFAFGALFAGTAASAHALLVGEWQRTLEGAAGVLAATAGGAAVTVTLGRWFHRLGRRRGAGRAAAAGHQLILGGGMALLGAFSFTYVGLITAWILAAGALVLAAVGLDAATWSGFAPRARRLVAARQVLGLAAGAGAAAGLMAGLPAGGHDGLRIAVTSLACIVVGVLLARRCPAEKPEEPRRAWSAAVPRRAEPGPEVPLLRLRGVGVAYDGVQVVFDAGLEMPEGAIVALLGTNGAGKTTTLRAISGLEPLCAGRIHYRGLDITRTPPTWRVGMGLHQVVGGEAVATDLSVEENLRLFAHSVSRPAAAAGTAAAFERFPRLAERRSQSAATLSGGEKQMLALSKAFITSPRLLLIDEFSLGLAPALVEELLPALRGIAARGTSILLVEQSVDLACEVADYAYVMEKGEIRHEGTPADLQAHGDLVRSVYLAGTTTLPAT
jgi:ABC-type branched-subunit amino acid transport system ATPase component